MGILRFLFALAVVFAHSPIGALVKTVPLIGGTLAVQSFFMIPGFYIAMILDGKYQNKFLFWSNRFLRLMPVYWLLCIVSLICFALINRNFFSDYALLGLGPVIYIIFSTIFVLGQDWAYFMTVHDKALIGTMDFLNHTPRLYTYFPVGQAWTMALEFYFYLLAPFLCRLRTIWVSLIVVILMAARFYSYNHGMDADPWIYRFFPFELALFLFGVLAFRIYKKFKDTAFFDKAKFMSVVMPLAAIAYPYFPEAMFAHASVNVWVFLAGLFVLMPVIFYTFKDNKYDRMIGNLSFPMYMVHLLVIRVLGNFALFTAHLWLYVLMVVVLAVSLAVLIQWFVEKPLDVYRMQRVKKYNQAKLN
jgi:peptidoglycan/LPS O-acetylase OafA/YrhL